MIWSFLRGREDLDQALVDTVVVLEGLERWSSWFLLSPRPSGWKRRWGASDGFTAVLHTIKPHAPKGGAKSDMPVTVESRGLPGLLHGEGWQVKRMKLVSSLQKTSGHRRLVLPGGVEVHQGSSIMRKAVRFVQGSGSPWPVAGQERGRPWSPWREERRQARSILARKHPGDAVLHLHLANIDHRSWWRRDAPPLLESPEGRPVHGFSEAGSWRVLILSMALPLAPLALNCLSASERARFNSSDRLLGAPAPISAFRRMKLMVPGSELSQPCPFLHSP